MRYSANVKKTTKAVVLSALMVALSVVIGFLCKSYLTFGAIRITFENLPVIIAGFAFGPVFGALAGAASDIVSAVASGYSVNPIITVGAAAVGFTAGLLYRHVFKGNGFLSIYLSAQIAHVFGSMIIKTVGLHVLYHYGFAVYLPRIPLYIGIALAESYIIYILYKNRRIARELGGRSDKQ